MFTPQEKQEIGSHFNEAMDHEDLHNCQAARFLNLNPCYITWIKNEKYWSDISQAAWDRFNLWHQGRDKLSAFVIPENEPIWDKRNNKKVEFSVKGKDLAAVLHNEGPEEHSPEAVFSTNEQPGKQKRKYTRHDQGEGKSVKIILQKEEIEQLNKRIDLLIEDNNKQAALIKDMQMAMGVIRNNFGSLESDQEKLAMVVEDLGKKAFVLEDETIAVMRQEIKDLQEGIGHLVTLAKKEDKSSLVMFQKNIYKS